MFNKRKLHKFITISITGLLMASAGIALNPIMNLGNSINVVSAKRIHRHVKRAKKTRHIKRSKNMHRHHRRKYLRRTNMIKFKSGEKTGSSVSDGIGTYVSVPDIENKSQSRQYINLGKRLRNKYFKLGFIKGLHEAPSFDDLNGYANPMNMANSIAAYATHNNEFRRGWADRAASLYPWNKFPRLEHHGKIGPASHNKSYIQGWKNCSKGMKNVFTA